MSKLKIVLLAALFLASSAASHAQSENAGKFSGTVFGDYYWMVNHHLDGSQNQQDIEGVHGFQFRRIYFTHDYQLNTDLSTRLRLEMDNAGNYNSSTSMTPSVKDAYLKWEPGRHSFFLGISGTPTWNLVEEVWGYRSLEETPVDLQGYGSSRDFGVGVKGPLDEEGSFTYHAMYGNGAGTGSESNRGKKYMLSLGYQPNPSLVVEVYGDYNNRPGPAKWYTSQLFLGYRTEAFTLGGLLAHQIRDNNIRDDDQTVASVFGHFPLDDRFRGVLRIDHTFNNNPNGSALSNLPVSPRAEATFLLAADRKSVV